MLAYLAGAIEYSPDLGRGWRKEITPFLREDLGHGVYDPAEDERKSLTAEEQGRFSFSLGPMSFDIAGFVGLRLSEHALHTWDIEVALGPGATVSPEATRFVIDSLGLIARFSAKPTGREHTVYVQTHEPARDFTITFGPESVVLNPGERGHDPDLELPAEAFIRLVYGRHDPDHTPPVRGAGALAEVRRAFPGI